MANIEDIYPRILRAIEWLAQGYTKTRACDECGISAAQFNHYVLSNDQLSMLAQEAEDRGYDALAEALVEINTSRHGSSDPKMAGVLSKNIQWYLARRKAKTYGDRVTVEHTITADKVIVEALTRGKMRALSGPVIEGVALDLTDDALSAEELAELALLV